MIAWQEARHSAGRLALWGLGIALIGLLIKGATDAFGSSSVGFLYIVAWGAIFGGLLTAPIAFYPIPRTLAGRPKRVQAPLVPRAPVQPPAPAPLQRTSDWDLAANPTKRCLGCNRRVPISATRCPHCAYSFSNHGAPVKPESQPQPTAPVKRPDPAIADFIRMLGTLRDEGLLTEQEFQTKKTALLARI